MTYAFIIEPESFDAFGSEENQLEQCKEWGLLSDKAAKTKTFLYKRNGLSVTCSVVGAVDSYTAVIEFDNKQRHCIHPSYLKEMQASTFGARLTAGSDKSAEADSAPEGAPSAVEAAPKETKPEETAAADTKPDSSPAEKASPAKGKKEKAQKLQLPEEKVKMTATVKEFTTVPNHFADTDDEVIVYEAVTIVEPAAEVGDAWSSHSATLKKLELEVGDMISFEAKIVAKKLTKHPVPYKINNPAKIQKI